MAADTKRMWAVIPVAGSGKRLRPHTYTRPKPLLHVAGQPIMGHILDQLRRLGVSKIVLVVGYMGELIVDYVRGRHDFEVVESVPQPEQLGLGHATLLTRAVVGDDPMMIVYGDTIFECDLSAVLERNEDATIGVKKVGDPSRFGVVVEQAGKVIKLVEKPETFVSDLAIVGVNMIARSDLLFDCLQEMVDSDLRTRGEYQLTDGFQRMVEGGANLGCFSVDHWFDCGTQEALLDTNRHMLQGCVTTDISGETVILPPVHIESTAEITGSVIGPYVSVGAGSKVISAIIRNSILGEQATVRDIVLENSIVGFQAAVVGSASSLNVGDLSEIRH